MKKFRLGIMGLVWNVEAESLDVAVIALRVWGPYPTIPIVCYSEEKQSKFGNLLGASDEFFESVVNPFLESNKKAIKDAAESIQEEAHVSN
jgi:hypothetical protein